MHVKKNIYFNIGAFSCAVIFLFIHFLLGPVEAVLALNGSHNIVADLLFKNFTLFGEWLGVLICLISILFHKKWKLLLPLATVTGVAVLTSYVLKHMVFPDSYRPRKILNNDSLIHFVDGVRVNIDFSYPSGHTLAIISSACFLSWFYARSAKAQFLVMLFAMLAALSRVYLFQHFYIDIASSIFIGLALNGVILWLFRSYFIETKLK